MAFRYRLRVSMTPIHLVLRIEYRLSRCYGAWEMLHFSLMNRLTETESAIFISLFWFGCSRWIDFFQYLFLIEISLTNLFKFPRCIKIQNEKIVGDGRDQVVRTLDFESFATDRCGFDYPPNPPPRIFVFHV